MQKYYYVTPQYSVAHNAKVGCTSMGCGIIRTYYPELIAEVQRNSDNGTNNWIETPLWQLFCPKELIATKPVVLLVRDPLKRLKSALVETGIEDVETAIDAIRNNGSWQFSHLSDAHLLKDNPHFLRQSSYISGETHLFKFPEHLPQAIEFLGLGTNFPHLNQADREISIPQRVMNFVNQIYANDFNLYNSIINPDTVINGSVVN